MYVFSKMTWVMKRLPAGIILDRVKSTSVTHTVSGERVNSVMLRCGGFLNIYVLFHRILSGFTSSIFQATKKTQSVVKTWV